MDRLPCMDYNFFYYDVLSITPNRNSSHWCCLFTCSSGRLCSCSFCKHPFFFLNRGVSSLDLMPHLYAYSSFLTCGLTFLNSPTTGFSSTVASLYASHMDRWLPPQNHKPLTLIQNVLCLRMLPLSNQRFLLIWFHAAASPLNWCGFPLCLLRLYPCEWETLFFLASLPLRSHGLSSNPVFLFYQVAWAFETASRIVVPSHWLL